MSRSCRPITGLKLDKKSRDKLASISEKKNYANLLATALSAGVFAKIFTKSSAPEVEYNITQTNWTTYAKAMQSIPGATRKALQTEYGLMALYYERHYNPKLLAFWRGLYHGCD